MRMNTGLKSSSLWIILLNKLGCTFMLSIVSVITCGNHMDELIVNESWDIHKTAHRY